MYDPERLTTICELLEQKYGPQGRHAAQLLRRWISGEIPDAFPDVIERHLDAKHLDLIFDAFWQVLPFGTGGRRGRVGYGPNRVNPSTIAMTVQGHCNYLRGKYGNKEKLSVVVANDVRVFMDITRTYTFLGAEHPLVGLSARQLGKLACEIYAGNGFIAYFAQPEADNALLSTPELSFLIAKLRAIGGVNLSASHNPPDDNGIKVYDEYGSQPTAPTDEILVNAMGSVTKVVRMPFNDAVRAGAIRGIPDRLHEEYITAYLDLFGSDWTPRADQPIVYTPLCGCGLTTAGEVLKRIGFPILTPKEEYPDGTFAIIPFKAPNPEVAQATEHARGFADRENSGIVLSSDPDADRIGLEAKLADGSWYHFDGNQIAAILCYYLMLDPSGPRRKGLVIETLVTTKLVGHITEKAGGSILIDDLLVGFKYVAEVLKSLERTGRYRDIECSPSDLVLATEESHGVILLPTIRDKDATPACMYLAALYQKLKAQSKTFLDYYASILEELGGFDTVNRSIMMTGAEGMQRKERILKSLRQSPPSTLGGKVVNKFVDYWDQKPPFGPFVSETDKLPRNVLQYFTPDFIITIRPSGTEAKLKLYCQLLPEPGRPTVQGLKLLQEARAKADKVARVIYNELLGRIGLSIGEAALMLPDIIDLDRKKTFETKAADLRDQLKANRFQKLDEIISWLKTEMADLTPGADPCPALKEPLAFLCADWSKDLAGSSTFRELQQWAGAAHG